MGHKNQTTGHSWPTDSQMDHTDIEPDQFIEKNVCTSVPFDLFVIADFYQYSEAYHQKQWFPIIHNLY